MPHQEPSYGLALHMSCGLRDTGLPPHAMFFFSLILQRRNYLATAADRAICPSLSAA